MTKELMDRKRQFYGLYCTSGLLFLIRSLESHFVTTSVFLFPLFVIYSTRAFSTQFSFCCSALSRLSALAMASWASLDDGKNIILSPLILFVESFCHRAARWKNRAVLAKYEDVSRQ